MRKFAFILMTMPVLALVGCTAGANHLANPLTLPLRGNGNAASKVAYNQTRGQVEVFVKTNHPALVADIQRGGGICKECWAFACCSPLV